MIFSKPEVHYIHSNELEKKHKAHLVWWARARKNPHCQCQCCWFGQQWKAAEPWPRGCRDSRGSGFLAQQVCALLLILPLRASSAVLATFPHPECHLSSPTHGIVDIFPVEGKWSDSAPSQKILVWPWMCWKHGSHTRAGAQKTWLCKYQGILPKRPGILSVVSPWRMLSLTSPQKKKKTI